MDVKVGLYKESWTSKYWCFWTVMLEKTLESPLDCKEIQPVHSEGDQPWDFFGRNDAEAKTPVLWPPHAKSWLIGKDSDAGRGWGQEEKGTTEDEMAGWHHWLDGRESEWTLGIGDGQGGLVCCNSWGHKKLDMTERLNWTDSSIKTIPWLFFPSFPKKSYRVLPLWSHSTLCLPFHIISQLFVCDDYSNNFVTYVFLPRYFFSSIWLSQVLVVACGIFCLCFNMWYF